MSINQRLIISIAIASLVLLSISIKAQTQATDYFRSRTSGFWNSPSTWESSHDGITWINSTELPTSSANQITITNNSIVSITSYTTADQLVVMQGSTLSVEFPFLLVNSGDDDLIVYGIIRINSTFSTSGQIRVMDGAEYIQNMSKNNSLYTCIWENGSTFKMIFTDPISTINIPSGTYYNFICDGGNVLSSNYVINLPADINIIGTLKFFSALNAEIVLTSSSMPIHYYFNNVEMNTAVRVSINSALVTIQISGNLSINGSSASTRLCLGKDITAPYTFSNTNIEISGNINITGSAGINSSSTHKYGTIKFMNTSSIQYVSNNANIRRVNYIVNPDVSVSFNGIIIDQGYSILMKNNSSLVTNSQIPVTVERNVINADWTIPYDGWHLLSSPVANQALSIGGFTNAPYDFYMWSEEENQWLNQKVPANNISSFIPGQGYLASYDNGGSLTFTGTLNSTPITFNNLSVSQTSPYSGFHLLGNPFPCSLDWNAAGWIKTNISGVAQVWDENARNYLPLTADNGIIPPTQGFFVQASSASNSITIPTSARVHSNQPFYKDIPANILRLRITSNMDSTFDETVIRFTVESSADFDLTDGHKLSGSENSPQVYSVLSSGENMCVNSLPSNNSPETVPVYFEPGIGNTYILETLVNTMQSDVYLEDKKAGSITLLKEGTLIDLDASSADEISRFVLHFGTVGIPEGVSSKVNVYSFGKSIYFKECNKRTYRILDISGRVVASGETNNSSLYQMNAGSLKAGVYFVIVNTADNTYSTHKIFL